MGCGASTASPPVEADAKKPARADGQQQQQPSRLLVPVIGLEVSGKSAICDSVCEQLRADGRHCARLDVDSLVKAEIVAGTDIGAEIANLIQQGKLVPQATTLRLLQSALRSSPPDGVFLIEDYPKTVAALDTMAEDFGQAPRLALLFGLGEDVAKQRIVEQADEPTALRRMRSFKMQSDSVVAALEDRGLLQRIDASTPVEQAAQAAAAHVRAAVTAAEGAASGGGGAAGSSSGKWVLVMGGPGAGKATHCARLAAKLGCVHLSVEQLMKNAVKDQSEVGRAIADMVKGGKIIPGHIYVGLLESAISQRPTATHLIDGFPRSVDSLGLLEDRLGACKCALYLTCPEATMLKRATQRGGAADTSADAVQRRIRTFHSLTLPVIETLQKRKVMSQVDVSGGLDQVHAAVCKAYEKL